MGILLTHPRSAEYAARTEAHLLAADEARQQVFLTALDALGALGEYLESREEGSGTVLLAERITTAREEIRDQYMRRQRQGSGGGATRTALTDVFGSV